MKELRKKLTIPEAIARVADAVCNLLEWFKCHAGLATKSDLQASEQRIIEAINLVCRPKPEGPRVRFAFGVGQPQNKQKGDTMPINIKLTNEQKVKVTLKPVTDTGKPAVLDGAPTWEVVSGNATVIVDEGGLSATLVSADDPGDTQFMVKADADIGEGVEEISDIVTLNVVGATAKNLGLVAGTPEPK